MLLRYGNHSGIRKELGVKEFANPGVLSPGGPLQTTLLRFPVDVEVNRHHDLSEQRDMGRNH